MANNQNLKPFPKGPDPRRNLKGRPKKPENLGELMEYIRAYLAEPSTKNRSRLDKVLAKLEKSAPGVKTLFEYSYGKVPNKVDLTSGGQPLNEAIARAIEKVYGSSE